ncbi:Bicupin, oxalate decarboxylase/oxidase [Choiromyces venosus 120613-1]|uniref:Bicupin, oxalate decarboxylase/oxidase n=1 Tax=Choiromyces venosus 120613-1 TaxID=1336337 RepID=A0A3N4JAN3_9PEZI|nr:Bicupin, oxalate decarboxylase/oxidase [Choiromyces venosus 120613-1]
MKSRYLSLLLLHLASAAPAPPLSSYATRVISTSGVLTATVGLAGPDPSAPPSTQNTTDIPIVLAPGQDSNSNGDISFDFLNITNPQPIRGDLGASDPGPHNSAYDQQNPNTLARPSTDSGDVQQAKWPMGLSNNRLTNAEWARQQNIAVLPAAKEMAGVDMRLELNAYRELHWHSANEWAYIFNGSARISAIDSFGHNFVDDVKEGDLWYFPSNFGVPMAAFDKIPESQLYIFGGTPAPADIEKQNVTSPYGQIPAQTSFSFHFSEEEPLEVPGGSVKIIAAALHPNSDEWNFSLSGRARITVFDAPDAARTFDYAAGDVGYIAIDQGHYIENVGDENVVVLEILKAPQFQGISLGQWMALTPPQVIQDTLGLDDATLEGLTKEKQFVVAAQP